MNMILVFVFHLDFINQMPDQFYDTTQQWLRIQYFETRFFLQNNDSEFLADLQCQPSYL
jgi:hypothetical protein